VLGDCDARLRSASRSLSRRLRHSHGVVRSCNACGGSSRQGSARIAALKTGGDPDLGSASLRLRYCRLTFPRLVEDKWSFSMTRSQRRGRSESQCGMIARYPHGLQILARRTARAVQNIVDSCGPAACFLLDACPRPVIPCRYHVIPLCFETCCAACLYQIRLITAWACAINELAVAGSS
jgi:hypothetical protein